MTYTYTPKRIFFNMADEYLGRTEYEIRDDIRRELALELEGACDDRWEEVRARIDLMLKGANRAS